MSDEVLITDFTDEISEMFNIGGGNKPSLPEVVEDDEPIEPEVVNYPVAPTESTELAEPIDHSKRLLEAHSDYQFARGTLHNSIEKGNKALGDLVDFACKSGGPEAFKQVSSVMDSIAKSAKQLLEFQQQMNTMERITTPGSGAQNAQTITNNTTIVETTKDGSFEGTREEAMEARRLEREQRAASTEKQVN